MLLILGVVLLPVGLLMMRAGAAGLLILGVFLIMGAVRSKSVSNRKLKEWQAKVDRFDNVCTHCHYKWVWEFGTPTPVHAEISPRQ